MNTAAKMAPLLDAYTKGDKRYRARVRAVLAAIFAELPATNVAEKNRKMILAELQRVDKGSS